MEMTRPSTPFDDENFSLITGCVNNASTSSDSWPLTELALETPERIRLRFRKRSSSAFMSPPRSITIKSPQTPKLYRMAQKPGDNLFKNSPSPLRRFQVSHSSTPLTDKFSKTTASGFDLRICGNEPFPITGSTLPLSKIEPNLNHTSTTDDSGFLSLGDISTYSQPSAWESHPAPFFDDSGIEYSFHGSFSENCWDYSNDSILSQTSTTAADNQLISLQTSYQPQSDTLGLLKPTFSPVPSIASTNTPANVDTVSIEASKITEKSKETEAKTSIKTKQRSLEDEILAALDKYHDEPFNIEYAKKVDMTEFKKLKLMSSLSSNYYKTVLGRSKDQLQITREAHKHLNQVNSKRVR